MAFTLLLLTLSLWSTLVNTQTTPPPTTTTTTTTTTSPQTTATGTGTATQIDCGINKIYNSCGSMCPENCTHFDPPPACSKVCSPGCFCKEGYVLDVNGICVPKEKCLSCSGNTTYSSCGTSCPDHCDKEEGFVRPCTMQCLLGCVCKPGYVHVSGKSGPCVLQQDCPVKNIKNVKQ
ncbi:inducible metalloproteinase inhibitor protein-like [Pelobates fuscus]|uniref:inducible metalloproteinase inhibitor protein-like n=1 Tax=Pelobates fuscus TaxID=191477 RepID=UPI002FE43FD6